MVIDILDSMNFVLPEFENFPDIEFNMDQNFRIMGDSIAFDYQEFEKNSEYLKEWQEEHKEQMKILKKELKENQAEMMKEQKEMQKEMREIQKEAMEEARIHAREAQAEVREAQKPSAKRKIVQ